MGGHLDSIEKQGKRSSTSQTVAANRRVSVAVLQMMSQELEQQQQTATTIDGGTNSKSSSTNGDDITKADQKQRDGEDDVDRRQRVPVKKVCICACKNAYISLIS